jgi:uroporphyrin-III C-methyltransferase
LRAVRVTDRTGILSRLSAAEARAAAIPIEGLLAVERESEPRGDLPDGFFARARAIVGSALAGLIRVRRVDERGGTVVTQDEELVRRQHLQLLLFTARTALARHDQPTYRGSLASARQWLGDYFDVNAPATQTLLREIQLLEAVDIDPRLPDISKSTDALQRVMPRGTP